MTAADTRARLAQADGLLKGAAIVRDFGDDAAITTTANVIGSLAVLSGIASADAICGHALGYRSGENHSDAVKLLQTATKGRRTGGNSSQQLARLLEAKTTTQYSAQYITDARADDLYTYAERLLSTAQDNLAGRI
jgi:hypothetical protein